jgi:uncharacterized protein
VLGRKRQKFKVIYLGDRTPQINRVSVANENLISEAASRLAAEFQPVQIWIFGSHAWGAPDMGSDLDLLVVVNDSKETPARRAQRAHRCLKGLGVAKDVLVKTRAEFDRLRTVAASLDAQIATKGRLIYGSSKA